MLLGVFCCLHLCCNGTLPSGPRSGKSCLTPSSAASCAASPEWSGHCSQTDVDQYIELVKAHRILEFSGLILAAILTSGLSVRRSTTGDWATMPPSFVVDFTSLLLFGPNATMLVATAGTVTQRLTDSQRSHASRRMLLNAATVMAATQAAGFVHRALGGTMGHFAWPEQGVPIAAAVVAYCFVKSASAEIIVPLFTRQPVNRSWPKSLLRGCPSYFIGASVAVGLVEVIDHRMWEVLPVAAVPLYFFYRAYCAHVIRLEEEHRRREVIDPLDHGMSVVDSNWPGHALER